MKICLTLLGIQPILDLDNLTRLCVLYMRLNERGVGDFYIGILNLLINTYLV